jgi:hypothetical protein
MSHIWYQLKAVLFLPARIGLALQLTPLHEAHYVLAAAPEAALHKCSMEPDKVDEWIGWIEYLESSEYQGEGVAIPAERCDLIGNFCW